MRCKAIPLFQAAMKNQHLLRRVSLYATISLAFILFGMVFTFRIEGEKQRSLMKGYLFSFSVPRGCGGIPVPRIYSKYYFTADARHNDSTLHALQQDLGAIGRSYDCLHAADITFSDHTTYDYYLKTIAICHEYPPKEMVPFENRMYVHGISRQSIVEDSLYKANIKQFGAPELSMNYP